MQKRLPPLWEVLQKMLQILCVYSSSVASERIATRQGDNTISTNVPATSRPCIVDLLSSTSRICVCLKSTHLFNSASLPHIVRCAHAPIVVFSRQMSHPVLPPLRNPAL